MREVDFRKNIQKFVAIKRSSNKYVACCMYVGVLSVLHDETFEGENFHGFAKLEQKQFSGI